jgi:hypothetical protein
VPPDRAQPIHTAPRQPDTSILLFCPEQGGWQVGGWWTMERPRWVAVLDATIELEPTYWMPTPADPA